VLTELRELRAQVTELQVSLPDSSVPRKPGGRP